MNFILILFPMGIALFRVLFWIVPRLTCKPGSVVYGHLSGNAVAGELKRCSRLPPGEQPVRRQPNLAPDGVYTARGVSAAPVSSYLPFPSLQDEPAVCFCCTFLGVASTGRYPASCSAVLGLSSRPVRAARPYDQLGIALYIILYRARACQRNGNNCCKSFFVVNSCLFSVKRI